MRIDGLGVDATLSPVDRGAGARIAVFGARPVVVFLTVDDDF